MCLLFRNVVVAAASIKNRKYAIPGRPQTIAHCPLPIANPLLSFENDSQLQPTNQCQSHSKTKHMFGDFAMICYMLHI